MDTPTSKPALMTLNDLLTLLDKDAARVDTALARFYRRLGRMPPELREQLVEALVRRGPGRNHWLRR